MFNVKIIYNDNSEEILKDYVSLKPIFGVLDLRKENGAGTIINLTDIKKWEYIR